MKLPKLLFCILFVSVYATIIPAQNNITFEFSNNHHEITIPFDYWNNHIYVKLQINDSDTLEFLFDSGAGSSGIMIDSSIAAEINLKQTGKITANTIGGKSEFPITDSVSISINDINIFRQKAAWFPLKEQEIGEGHKIDGILGYSFIKDFVIEIDYKSKIMSIMDPEYFANNNQKETIQLIDIKQNRVPIINGNLSTKNNKKIATTFIIDLGHDETLILGRVFIEKNKLQDDTLSVQPKRFNEGLGGQTSNKVGVVKEISFGNYTFEYPNTLFSFDVEGNFAALDGCLLGGALFQNRKIIFNYREEYIIISK